jgi:hypothetical protein
MDKNDLAIALIIGIIYLIIIMGIIKLREVLTKRYGKKDVVQKEQNFEFLYILDYSIPAIYEIELNTDRVETIDDILKRYNLKESECSYMYSSEKLSLHYINDKVNEVDKEP